MLGLGVMIHHLAGGSKHAASEYIGKKIAAVEMAGEKLTLTFDDGRKIAVWDDGQSCCENRYMTTDDDIQSLVGGDLMNIESKPGPGVETSYDEHETVFVEVSTSKGLITIVNHNEHNGYYGGFGLTITEE